MFSVILYASNKNRFETLEGLLGIVAYFQHIL